MLKRIILVLVIMISGLLTGYYSEPVYELIWSGRESTPAGLAGAEGQKDRAGSTDDNTRKYVTAEEAVSAVKNVPWVNNLIRVSELDGTTLTFKIDYEPSDDYPVWLVEVTERYPDKVPETKYVQVEAGSGRILEIQKKDMEISGIGLDMTRNQALEAGGSPRKTRRKWDNRVQQTLRTDIYEGMEVIYDKNNVVVRVTASEKDCPGPGGIVVGDSREGVIRKLGKAGAVSTNLWTYTLMDKKDYRLLLDINGEGRVTAVTISSGLLD